VPPSERFSARRWQSCQRSHSVAWAGVLLRQAASAVPRCTVGYRPRVGVRNYLIEGVSGTGKTSVCHELRRRGFQAVNGDTELAYQGDPETGEPTDVPSHWHHLWHVDMVRALASDVSEQCTFFCGGSRNFSSFQDLFDGIFVLEVDLETLNRRLEQRLDDEFGATRRSVSSSRGCTRRKKTPRGTGLSSTPPRRSPRSWTRSCA